MNVRAQLLTLKKIEGTSTKTGKPYSFNSLALLDLDSSEAELIKVNVNDAQAESVTQHLGKVVPIAVQFVRGGFSFNGFCK